MENCIFCDIVAKKVPADIYYEDASTLAFRSLDPITEGHVIVIPKKHVANMLDIDVALLKSVTESTQKVAKMVVEEFRASGFNLLMANGKDAQQYVFHFHWHIVPRFPDDGLDLWIRQGL